MDALHLLIDLKPTHRRSILDHRTRPQHLTTDVLALVVWRLERSVSPGLFLCPSVDLARATRELWELIPELVRAANQVGKLTILEKGRLLGRSIEAIRELNSRAAITANPLAFDETIILQFAAATIDTLPDEAVTATFLKAADSLLNLKRVLDAEYEDVDRRCLSGTNPG